MIPELKEIREIAKKADYGRIPVKKEIYADRYTPIEVMRTLRAAADTVICWKVPIRMKSGGGIPFWDTRQPWNSPAQTVG